MNVPIKRITRPARTIPIATVEHHPLPRRDVTIITPAANPIDTDIGPKVDHVAVIARYKGKVNNRASAIRAMCVECSGGALSEVRLCRVVKCALHPFRNGDDPFRKKRTDGFASKNTESED